MTDADLISVELDEAQRAFVNGDLLEAQRHCVRASIELGIMHRKENPR
jgi:hypothetical protein